MPSANYSCRLGCPGCVLQNENKKVQRRFLLSSANKLPNPVDSGLDQGEKPIIEASPGSCFRDGASQRKTPRENRAA